MTAWYRLLCQIEWIIRTLCNGKQVSQCLIGKSKGQSEIQCTLFIHIKYLIECNVIEILDVLEKIKTFANE